MKRTRAPCATEKGFSTNRKERDGSVSQKGDEAMGDSLVIRKRGLRRTYPFSQFVQ